MMDKVWEKSYENIETINDFFAKKYHSEQKIQEAEVAIKELCQLLGISQELEMAACVLSVIFERQVRGKITSFYSLCKHFNITEDELIQCDNDFTALIEGEYIGCDNKDDIENATFWINEKGLSCLNLNITDCQNDKIFTLVLNGNLTFSDIEFISKYVENKNLDKGELFRLSIALETFIVADIVKESSYDINCDTFVQLEIMDYIIFGNKGSIEYFLKSGYVITQEAFGLWTEILGKIKLEESSMQIMSFLKQEFRRQKIDKINKQNIH